MFRQCQTWTPPRPSTTCPPQSTCWRQRAVAQWCRHWRWRMPRVIPWTRRAPSVLWTRPTSLSSKLTLVHVAESSGRQSQKLLVLLLGYILLVPDGFFQSILVDCCGVRACECVCVCVCVCGQLRSGLFRFGHLILLNRFPFVFGHQPFCSLNSFSYVLFACTWAAFACII